MQEEIEDRTQQSWRPRKAADGQYEYHRLGRLGGRGSWFIGLGYQIFLKYRRIATLDATKGDALEVFNGTSWEDWLASKTEGIHADYWVDYDTGILYMHNLWLYITLKDYVVRVKYRYGSVNVIPQDIKTACTYLTAMQLVIVNDKLFLLPEGGTSVLSAAQKLERWESRVNAILDRHREWTVGGG